jgi:esterase/lipase superfamily enzyme
MRGSVVQRGKESWAVVLYEGRDPLTGKKRQTWHSERIGHEITVVRWGELGAPALLFPTAGGDAEEVERNGLVSACADLLSAGRLKLYSVDSLAGKVMVSELGAPAWRMEVLNAYHQAVRHEVVPAIHADSGGRELPVVAAGASIGAFNAVAMVCRFPEVFSAAVGMSGTYDLQRMYEGQFTDDLYFSSPLHFLPGLDGQQLDDLRQRFVVLASGVGAWESIDESWRLADVLGSKGVPNRVDSWGQDWEHDWGTWLRMLPQYLDELLP